MNPFGKISTDQARFEMDYRAQQRRNPDSHKLAEYMAERQRVQNPEWMKQALILEIFPHFPFDGTETRKYVAMCVDHTLGLAGSARSKDDL